MSTFRALLRVAGLVLLFPALAQAKGGHSSGHGGAHSSAPAHAAHSYGYPAYSRGYGYYGPGYLAAPLYSAAYLCGWGLRPWGYYGYGYYPWYGGPVVAEETGIAPPSITSSVFVGGMVSSGGPGLDLRGVIEGSGFGGNLDLATLPGVASDGTATVFPYATAHLTYSFLSDFHYRVRAEAGFSAIRAPGVSYIGPDVGLSGQLALIGPLAIEGSLHWTPIPADILDADAGLALHFGNLGFRGGWRILRIDDTRVNDLGTGAVAIVSGPTVSVGLVF